VALTTGARLGSYEVVGLLGKGGMGEVYRARDTRLGRDVALKVLPDPLANEAEPLARFEREAQTLAALNHPHIAHIYGVESGALVMELVEGLTLAQVIERGPLSIAEATTVALQIADALEAAHELGIIHRDLKPSNVKVRPDGAVKVLDFGLAKALAGSPAVYDNGMFSSPTIRPEERPVPRQRSRQSPRAGDGYIELESVGEEIAVLASVAEPDGYCPRAYSTLA
jgi:serine/threonine protein kinase